MNGGPSGFRKYLKFRIFWYSLSSDTIWDCILEFFFHVFVLDNAPVTKTIVIATALFTIPFGVRGYSLKLGLAYQV